MSRPYRMLVALLALTLPLAAPAFAQEADDDAAMHDALRDYRDQLVQAILDDDVATQIELTHPDIVTMWQDGRVVVGHDALQQFLDELGRGSDRGFLGYEQEPTAADLTAIYDGQFGFVHGTSVAKYDLYGMEFNLPNYWTATLLNDDGEWKMVGYHVSSNIADNPFLDAAKSSLYLGGGAALLVGLIVGFFIGRRAAAGRADEGRA